MAFTYAREDELIKMINLDYYPHVLFVVRNFAFELDWKIGKCQTTRFLSICMKTFLIICCVKAKS